MRQKPGAPRSLLERELSPRARNTDPIVRRESRGDDRRARREERQHRLPLVPELVANHVQRLGLHVGGKRRSEGWTARRVVQVIESEPLAEVSPDDVASVRMSEHACNLTLQAIGRGQTAARRCSQQDIVGS